MTFRKIVYLTLYLNYIENKVYLALKEVRKTTNVISK